MPIGITNLKMEAYMICPTLTINNSIWKVPPGTPPNNPT